MLIYSGIGKFYDGNGYQQEQEMLFMFQEIKNIFNVYNMNQKENYILYIL